MLTNGYRYLDCFVAALAITASTATSSPDPAAAAEPETIPAKEVGKTTLLIGGLGLPIGEEVTIHGVKRSNGKSQNDFWVESINGRPFKYSVRVTGIDDWPENTRATLRGYEQGLIRFRHAKHTSLPNNAKLVPHQVLYLSFEVEEVLEPKNLDIQRR